MTLRLRLSLLAALLLLGGLALFGGLAYLLFVEQQERELKALVARDLERLGALVQNPVVGARLLNTGQEGWVQQLVSRDGVVVLPPEARPLPLYATPTLDRSWGRPLLVAATPWRSPSGAVLGTIRVGLDVTEALAARATLLRSLLVSGIVIALAALAVGLVSLQRALRPLTQLARQAREIDPANPRLARYHGPEDEVATLAQALNQALENIRARQQAERAALAEVAHELAAPLSLVAGHLEALAASRPEDERLVAARDAARELLYTSQDLLTLARGELERPLELRVFDLAEVAARVAREYPGVTLAANGPAEVAGSPERMAQLVRNLVRNAVQASGGTAGVRIALWATKEEVYLEVRDQGPGIPPEELPRVFERFYTRRGGAGLGLSVAQRIARQHGGEIRVASEVGKGSRFTVVLPSLAARIVEHGPA